jgi:hypothetical protein
MEAEPFDGEQLDALGARIDGWLEELADGYDHIAAVGRSDDGERRWFVRMLGEEKDITTAWLLLRQRTLGYETYVMPAPEENVEELYAQLLRRNDGLVGAHFSIGAEDAVFLRGAVPAVLVDLDALDHLLGTLYAQVEQCFRSLLSVGFASRLGR